MSGIQAKMAEGSHGSDRNIVVPAYAKISANSVRINASFQHCFYSVFSCAIQHFHMISHVNN